jgi:hypothetical protein
VRSTEPVDQPSSAKVTPERTQPAPASGRIVEEDAPEPDVDPTKELETFLRKDVRKEFERRADGATVKIDKLACAIRKEQADTACVLEVAITEAGVTTDLQYMIDATFGDDGSVAWETGAGTET